MSPEPSLNNENSMENSIKDPSRFSMNTYLFLIYASLEPKIPLRGLKMNWVDKLMVNRAVFFEDMQFYFLPADFMTNFVKF